jgi:hypothetical protein
MPSGPRSETDSVMKFIDRARLHGFLLPFRAQDQDGIRASRNAAATSSSMSKIRTPSPLHGWCGTGRPHEPVSKRQRRICQHS